MSLEQSMKQAKASLSIEGMIVKKSHDELVRLILSKEITEEEFERRVQLLLLEGDK